MAGRRPFAIGAGSCVFAYLTQFNNPWVWPWSTTAGLDVQRLIDNTEFDSEKTRLQIYSFNETQLMRHINRYCDKGEVGRRVHREKMIMHVNWTIAAPSWFVLGGIWGGFSAYESSKPTAEKKPPSKLFAAFQMDPTPTHTTPTTPSASTVTVSNTEATTKATAEDVAKEIANKASIRNWNIASCALNRGLLSAGAGFLLLPVYLFFMDVKERLDEDKSATAEEKLKTQQMQAALDYPNQGLRDYLEHVLLVREMRRNGHYFQPDTTDTTEIIDTTNTT